MTPVTSLHLFQASLTLFLQSMEEPPSASNIDPIYLKVVTLLISSPPSVTLLSWQEAGGRYLAVPYSRLPFSTIPAALLLFRLSCDITCITVMNITGLIAEPCNPGAQWLWIIISRTEGLMCGINRRYMGDYGIAGLTLPKLCVWPVLTTKVTKKMTFNHNVAHGHQTDAELMVVFNHNFAHGIATTAKM